MRVLRLGPFSLNRVITAWGAPNNKKRGFLPSACRKHPSRITLRTLSMRTLYIAGTILTLNYLTWAIFLEGSQKFPHLGPVPVLALPIAFFLLCDTPEYSRGCIMIRQPPTVLASSSSVSSSTSHFIALGHTTSGEYSWRSLCYTLFVSSRPVRGLCAG